MYKHNVSYTTHVNTTYWIMSPSKQAVMSHFKNLKIAQRNFTSSAGAGEGENGFKLSRSKHPSEVTKKQHILEWKGKSV